MTRSTIYLITLLILMLATSVSAAPKFSEISGLANHTLSDRENLSLILAPTESASPELRQAAEEAMTLWNSGEFDAATALLDQLDSDEAAANLKVIGNWREPKPSSASPEFDSDIRIGSYDEIFKVDIDVHRPSGTIWVLAMVQNYFTYTGYLVYRSVDGGSIWTLMGSGQNTGNHIYDAAIAVVEDHLYIVYEWNGSVRMELFDAVVGGNVLLGNGEYSAQVYALANPMEGVREIVVVSGADRPSSYGRVCVISRTSHGNLHIDVNTAHQPNFDFDHRYTGVTDVSRGLSACYNTGPHVFETPAFYVSYITTGHQLRVGGMGGDEAHYGALFSSDLVDSKARVTSIAAYGEDVVVAFERGGDSRRLVYAYSINGGQQWWHSFFLDHTWNGGEMPAMCGSVGGGFGTVYTAYSSPYVTGPRYKWQSYERLGSLQTATPRTIANHFGGSVQPDIVNLGDGDFGIVYVCDTEGEIAYFDRGNFCCQDRVGDANISGDDEPTIGDISLIIDAKFITSSCDGKLPCMAEADVNQSGGSEPDCDDISIGDISTLVDYLFITGPVDYGPLPDCL